MVNKKKKAMTKIANGIRNLGSAVVNSRHEIMEVVNVNNRQAVATSSVSVALHIWKNEGTR